MLTLACKYNAFEEARDPRKTLRILVLLPVVTTLIYLGGISDTFVSWVFANYIVLLPSWPAVKAALAVPYASVFEKIKKGMTVLVPRFLRRRPSIAADSEEKQKME